MVKIKRFELPTQEEFIEYCIDHKRGCERGIRLSNQQRTIFEDKVGNYRLIIDICAYQDGYRGFECNIKSIEITVGITPFYQLQHCECIGYENFKIDLNGADLEKELALTYDKLSKEINQYFEKYINETYIIEENR